MRLHDLFRECARRGIRLSKVDDGLKVSPWEGVVDDELAHWLYMFKPGILAVLVRSKELPLCAYCSGQLFAVPTFDGFENLECYECGRCQGCRPASEAAIRLAARETGETNNDGRNERRERGEA